MDSKEALTRQLVVSTVMVVVMMMCFFISAGRMDIYRAWLFFGATFIYLTLSTITLYRYNPELLIQRLTISRESSKMWDEVLMRLSNLTVMLAIPAAAGVDVGRLIWSELDWPYAILG